VHAKGNLSWSYSNLCGVYGSKQMQKVRGKYVFLPKRRKKDCRENNPVNTSSRQ